MADDLRDALSKAFDESVAAEQPAPEAAPAEAPAPAPEGSEPPVLETPSANDASRERDEKGRFTKRTDEPAAKAPEVGQQVIAPQPQLQKALDPNAQAAPKPAAPPPGWSVAAKAEFDKLSPAVREAIVKREAEVSAGFQQYQAYKGLEPYAEIAKNAGVTLDSAVEKWMAAEHKLATAFPDAIVDLCGYFNVDPIALSQFLYQRFQPGQGYQQPGYQSPHDPMSGEMRSIRAELEAFKQERKQEADAAINGEVQAFMADPAHKYFENVKPTIVNLLKSGSAQNLKDAYEQACWLNPEIRTLLINEQAQSKQAEAQRKASEARRAAGSLSPGSPLPNGTTGGSKGRSVRDDLLEAYNAHTI